MGRHIAMVINFFNPIVGGGEKQAERLARELIKRGHRVTVLTRKASADLPSEETQNGIRIVRLKGQRWLFSVRVALWLLRRHHQLDVVHAFQSNAPLVSSTVASIFCGFPVICTPLTGFPELNWVWGKDLHSLVRRGLYRRTRAWTAKSGEILSLLRQYSKDGVWKIPNGIDPDDFSPGFPASGSPIAVFVGRLEPPKRLDLVLKALGRVRTPIWLHVVGDGSRKREWQEMCEAQGINCVSFLGERTDVRSILQQASIFILASDAEGMPNALIEAMSCGLACVATGVGAIPEMLGNGAGIVVPPDDAEAISRALNSLLLDHTLMRQLGARAREYVLGNLAIDQVAIKFETVYDEVIRRRKDSVPGPF